MEQQPAGGLYFAPDQRPVARIDGPVCMHVMTSVDFLPTVLLFGDSRGTTAVPEYQVAQY